MATLDLFLHDIDTLKKYDDVECTISFYPLDPNVKADDFTIDPFEDYISDLTLGKRSTYTHILGTSHQFFGLLLGLIITVFFALFNPSLLISVESIVSVFAAYTVGKEIWHDVDDYLQNVSRGHRLRWSEPEFFYERQQFGTLQRFWQQARLLRYGYGSTLPHELDLISHSNSKTIEMHFIKEDLRNIGHNETRILSILGNKQAEKMFKTKHYFVAVKIGLVRKVLFGRYVEEFLQAFDGNEIGSLDLTNTWHPHQALIKKSWRLGQLAWFTEPGNSINIGQILK